MKYRINKFIAASGICSRRNADKLIESGEIKVNGKKIYSLGIEIDDEKDVITFQGKKVENKNNFYYILINKPLNCVSSTKTQDKNISTVLSYLPKISERLFPVGRLDKNTTGALLITNDGELTHRLLHPKKHITKEYKAVVKGILKRSDILKLRNGIMLNDGITLPAKVYVNSRKDDITKLKLEISEGRNRQIRRMFSALNAKVIKLHRSKFAGISIGQLKPGQWRSLTIKELDYLHKITKDS